MADRVQIPAYTDRWMMGDRFGEIVKITKWQSRVKAVGVRAALLTGASKRSAAETYEIAHVRLDKSGKTVRVILNDCTPV